MKFPSNFWAQFQQLIATVPLCPCPATIFPLLPSSHEPHQTLPYPYILTLITAFIRHCLCSPFHYTRWGTFLRKALGDLGDFQHICNILDSHSLVGKTAFSRHWDFRDFQYICNLLHSMQPCTRTLIPIPPCPIFVSKTLSLYPLLLYSIF